MCWLTKIRVVRNQWSRWQTKLAMVNNQWAKWWQTKLFMVNNQIIWWSSYNWPLAKKMYGNIKHISMESMCTTSLVAAACGLATSILWLERSKFGVQNNTSMNGAKGTCTTWQPSCRWQKHGEVDGITYSEVWSPLKRVEVCWSFCLLSQGYAFINFYHGCWCAHCVKIIHVCHIDQLNVYDIGWLALSCWDLLYDW